MKRRSRQEKLNDGLTYNGFDLKGIHYNPLNGGSMKFLERIKSPIYTSEYEGYSEMDIVIEYLYATSHSWEELAKAPEKWDVLQFEYAASFHVSDITNPEILGHIVRDIENQNAASVTVRSEDTEKKTVMSPTG